LPNQVAAADDDLDFEVEVSGAPEAAVVAAAKPGKEPGTPEQSSAPSDNIIDDIVVEGSAERNPDGTFKARAAAPDPDDDGETDADAQNEDAPAKVAKPRNNPKARVEQAVSRQRDAERRADEAEARADAAEARNREPRRREEALKQPSDRERYLAMPGAPKQTDYTDYGEFIADQTLFLEEQRHRDRSSADQTRRSSAGAEQTRNKLNTAFNGLIQTAVKADPAFLENISPEVMNIPTFDVLKRGDRPTGWHVVGEEIRRSTLAPAVMQYFTDSPQILQRIATLPPREITRTMAILESRIAAASTGPAASRDISQAHPPIRPERGAPQLTGDEGSDSESVEAHIKRENALDRRRRSGR